MLPLSVYEGGWYTSGKDMIIVAAFSAHVFVPYDLYATFAELSWSDVEALALFSRDLAVCVQVSSW